MAFDWGDFSSGIGGLFGGLFGDSGKPYDEAEKKYQEYENKAGGINQPYIGAGETGVKNYQDWLNKQKNPTEFINNIMGDYNESPYAQYLQKQNLRAGQNFASANGLSGSTPMAQQIQENAGNISSKDMNSWLQNVLGINTQYGEGEHNMVNTGQNAVNNMTNFYNTQAQREAENAYNKNASKNNNFWNTIGSGIQTIGSFF